MSVPLRRATCVAALAVLCAGTAMTVAGSASAETVGGWAEWSPISGSSNNYATTMQLPAPGFPRARMATNSRGNVALPSGATTFLGDAGDRNPTDVGTKYGSSRNHAYINLRPEADNASHPSVTTYTFDRATPPSGWAFVLGDIDSDQVRVTAKDADGGDVPASRIDTWFRSTFNYAGDSDRPTWDADTSTLRGNAAAEDTNGASGWFEPDVSISSLTMTFTARAGFPVYQTWFASLARTISGTVAGANACLPEHAQLTLVDPDGTDLDTVTAGDDGTYTFGTYATRPDYTVRVEVPKGCAAVSPTARTGVDNTQDDATADFTVRKILPHPVSGTVKTADGTPVPGATVTLTAANGGGTKTIMTDADGTYLFDDNQDGSYAVAVTGLPDGYTTADPASRSVQISGAAITGQDFTLVEQPSVSGTVSGGGHGLGGVTVTLTAANGTETTTVTEGDGSYRFEHVPANSTYTISVETPPGYRPALARSGVEVGTTDVTDEDFHLSRPGAIGGQLTAGSTPVAGATVRVEGPDGTTTLHTDKDGEYFVDGLGDGDYRITLSVPDGYVADGPTHRDVTITSAGEIRGGENFSVREAPASTSPTSSPPPTGSSTSTPPSTTSSSASGGGGAGPNGAGPNGVAQTGVPVERLTGYALLLLAAGAAVLIVGRRRPVRARARHR